VITDWQSAILILEMYNDTRGGLRCEETLFAIQDISQEAEAVLQSVNAIIPRLLNTPTQHYTSLDFISPLVLHVIYMAAALHLNLSWSRPSSSHKEEYKALTAALEALSHRWKSAGKQAFY
jgi:hypothetical protein